MRKLLIFTILIVILTTFVIAGSGTGVDSILESVGLEKPSEWNSWNEQQKHTFLQNKGIYPKDGRKYKGDADISGFFDYLGVEKPKNWEQLNFEEKQEFVKNANTKKTKVNWFYLPKIYSIISSSLALFLIISSFFKRKNKIKSIARNLIYYILPLILITLGIIFPENSYFKELGEWAERLLVFLLLSKPISKIFSNPLFTRVVGYRTELGVASFWFFLIHSAGLFITKSLTILEMFKTPYLFWGSISGIGMIILGITSNNLSMKLFSKNWKKIQYLAYPVLFAALAHSSLIGNGNLNKFYLIGGIYSILKLMEWNNIQFRN